MQNQGIQNAAKQVAKQSKLKPTAKFVKDVATTEIHPVVMEEQNGEVRLKQVNEVFERKAEAATDPSATVLPDDPGLIEANLCSQDAKTECLVNARGKGQDKKRDAVIINWFDRLRTRLNS